MSRGDMDYGDVEAELRRHPAVRDCAILWIETGSQEETLVAYVVTTGRTNTSELGAFLLSSHLRAGRIPRAFVLMRSLPRSTGGALDQGALPMPVLTAKPRGGKGVRPGSRRVLSGEDFWIPMGFLTGAGGFLAFIATKMIWPLSVDLYGVPQPWAGLFVGLYIAEYLSFGLGVGFLLLGRQALGRLGRPRGLTTLAHLSMSWLLIAWWPQDMFYRLTAKTDWSRQATLVYTFNVTLMIAAFVLVLFASHARRESPSSGQRTAVEDQRSRPE